MKGGARNTKPERQRALEGSRVRPWHHPQPQVAVGVPERPPHLTDAERALWDYYAPQLAAVRVLTLQDRETLCQFVEARAQVEDIKRQQAAPEYRRLMVTVTIDGAGNEKVKAESNPLDAQRRLWTDLARKCAAELGLSPQTRARVAPVPDAPREDAFETFQKKALRAVK